MDLDTYKCKCNQSRGWETVICEVKYSKSANQSERKKIK